MHPAVYTQQSSIAEKIIQHVAAWIVSGFLIIYFMWAAQAVTSLPGLENDRIKSIFDIGYTSLPYVLTIILGAAPAFYLSALYLSPKLLLGGNETKVWLFGTVLLLYLFVYYLIMGFASGLFYFFGVPPEVKIALPVIIFAGLAGVPYSYILKLQEKVRK